MRGSAMIRKKSKTAKLGRTPSKVKTKKVEARGRKRAARDERDDDEEDGARGRFEPPARKDSSTLVVAIVAAILVVVGVAALAGGGGSSLVDEHEAEKAYNYVDGQYALAKGGDALAENRAPLRAAFQKVVDAFPNTESAAKAQKRIRELQ